MTKYYSDDYESFANKEQSTYTDEQTKLINTISEIKRFIGAHDVSVTFKKLGKEAQEVTIIARLGSTHLKAKAKSKTVNLSIERAKQQLYEQYLTQHQAHTLSKSLTYARKKQNTQKHKNKKRSA